MNKARKKAIKERIEFLEHQIQYNDLPGVHTYTQCSCGRKSCRAGTCSLCMQEEIAKLKSELKIEVTK
jgi:hypothetical protein